MANKPNSARYPNSSGCPEDSKKSSRFASRLNRIAPLAWRAMRLLPVLVCVLLLAAAPKAGRATPVVVFDGNVSSHCQTGDCCWKFTVKLDNPVGPGGFVYIRLIPNTNTVDDGCIDQTCWTSQGYPTCSGCPYKMKHNDKFGGPNEYDIEFLYSEPAGYTFDVYICGSNTCLSQFPFFNWYYDDGMGGVPEHKERLPLTVCYGEVKNGCAAGCTWITGNANQNPGGPSECWASFCIQSDVTPGPLCSVTLNFNPPLTNCQVTGNDPTGTHQHPKCYNSDHEVDHGIFSLPANWTATNDPVTGNLTLTCGNPPGGCIQGPCQGFCFSVPDCDDISRIVTVVSPDPCAGDVIVALKWAPNQVTPITQQEYKQNYPNPLDAETGFKTTIPFSTSDRGTAYLRIVDVKGNEVMSDNQKVDYAGQHFFYLTADNLTAGTYYYQIEFPKGVVIQNNKMLIVR